MSRTYKDRPAHLQQVRKNEEELDQVYIREKHFKQDRYKNPLDSCLDCSRPYRRSCKECGDQEVEDLVTIFEKSCRA